LLKWAQFVEVPRKFLIGCQECAKSDEGSHDQDVYWTALSLFSTDDSIATPSSVNAVGRGLPAATTLSLLLRYAIAKMRLLPSRNFQTTQADGSGSTAASGGSCHPCRHPIPGSPCDRSSLPCYPFRSARYPNPTVHGELEPAGGFQFRDAIKSATKDRALVGVRSGEFLQQSLVATRPSQARCSTVTADFYSYPSIDF